MATNLEFETEKLAREGVSASFETRWGEKDPTIGKQWRLN